MARPRKNPVESNEPFDETLTEQVQAPETVTEVISQAPVYVPPPPRSRLPREMVLERPGAEGAPYSRMFPSIRGGICEFCGVIDGRFPSQEQYKMCEHYRGMQARCAYCPADKDPNEIIRSSVIHVHEHPDKPGTLLMVCNSFGCSKAHLDRFKIALG